MLERVYYETIFIYTITGYLNLVILFKEPKKKKFQRQMRKRFVMGYAKYIFEPIFFCIEMVQNAFFSFEKLFYVICEKRKINKSSLTITFL